MSTYGHICTTKVCNDRYACTCGDPVRVANLKCVWAGCVRCVEQGLAMRPDGFDGMRRQPRFAEQSLRRFGEGFADGLIELAERVEWQGGIPAHAAE